MNFVLSNLPNGRQTDHTTLTTVRVYRPPSGSKLDFLEFTEWLTDNIVLDYNIVITGDFNVHFNNPNDDDAANFKYVIVALGFRWHILFPKHKSGNILTSSLWKNTATTKLEHAGKATSSPITASVQHLTL